MNINHRGIITKITLALTLMLSCAVGMLRADTGNCGGANITLPFLDVAGNPFFCQIAEAYLSGLTYGTTATSYSPHDPVTREQMAAFITRTMDQSLKRGSRRAALNQLWTAQSLADGGLMTPSHDTLIVKSDGQSLWVAGANKVSRLRSSDGAELGTWTGISGTASAMLVARGRVFIASTTGTNSPGRLYSIDPSDPPGAVTLLTTSLGDLPVGIAYDGSRIWTANGGNVGSISIVSLGISVSVTTIAFGFFSPIDIVYDGAHMWVADLGTSSVKKLYAYGGVDQEISTGAVTASLLCDGTNVWVMSGDSDVSKVTVVRAATGAILATLTGNGLNLPGYAAFDGERVLVTSPNGDTVSLWKAADLTPLGSFPAGLFGTSKPNSVCSDGVNFFVALQDKSQVARF